MPALPPIPAWENLHVVIVHIPIGLLLIAPVFMFAAMFPGRWREGLRIAALFLLLVGTAAAYVTKQSGEAAAELADRTPQINEVIEQHEERAELVVTVFATAAVLYAVFVGLSFAFSRMRRPAVSVPVQIVMLGIALFGALAIADTGHLGGRLVHELGVRAMM